MLVSNGGFRIRYIAGVVHRANVEQDMRRNRQAGLDEAKTTG